MKGGGRSSQPKGSSLHFHSAAQGGWKHAGQNDISKEGESTNSRNKAAATQGTINGTTDYSQKGRNSKPNSSLAAASTMSKMSDGKKLPAKSMNQTALTQGGAPRILSSSQTRDRGAKKPEMEDSNRGATTPKSVPLASIFKSPTSQEQLLTTSTNSAA